MIEFLLKYPVETWRDSTLLLASSWPTGWALALVVGGGLLIALALGSRRSASGHTLTLFQRTAIGTLQLAMLALAVLLVWQPSLSVDEVRPGSNVLAVLIDDSASMAYPDNGLRRIDAVREVLEDSVFQRLSGQFDLEYFRFTDAVAAMPEPSTSEETAFQLDATRDASALTRSIRQVLQRSASSALGGVVVLTDGIDTEPLTNAPGELAAWQIPVYAVGVGREVVAEDLGISDVMMPARLTPGSQLRARVTVVHGGPGLARIRVTQDGQLLGVTDAALENGPQTPVWVDIPLPAEGHHALTFSLDAAADIAARDVNPANNRLTRMLEVSPQVHRILYIEGEPRWEYKFLRRAVADDPGLELVSLLRVSPNRYYRQGIADPAELEAGFPTDRETLFAFQGIVIGSIEAASFSTEQLELVRDFVAERGGGLLLLGGRSGLGQGGWGNSGLAGVLPVNLPPPERESFSRQRWPVLRTPWGQQSPLLQLAGAASPGGPGEPYAAPGEQAGWESLPALADFQELGTPKPASRVLLDVSVAGQRQPLMVTQPYGRGSATVLATGGTWRWQMSLPVDDQRHETFWRQLLRGLGSEALEPFALEVNASGGNIELRAEVRDKAFRPSAGVPVTAVISGATRTRVTLTPQPDQAGVYTASVALAGDGPHFIEAGQGNQNPSAQLPEQQPERQPEQQPEQQPGAQTARAALFHAGTRQERVSMARNRTLLEAISGATGGAYFDIADIARLPDAVAASSTGITQTRQLPVWDAPLVLLLLVLLKGTEWLLRRRWAVI